MRWEANPIYIAGTGASRPKAVTVESAITAGRYDREAAAKGQLLATTIADEDERAVDFAVRAARQALSRSGYQTADLELLLYAVVLDSGIPVSNAGSYILRELGAEGGIADQIQSACAGALRAVDLAGSCLVAHDGKPAALVVAADCWPPTMVDRWRSGTPIVWADGGSAVVLSRERGFARLLALHTHSDPSLEALNRGAESFGRPPSWYPLDFGRRAEHFFGHTMSKSDYYQRRNAGLLTAVERATAEAHVALRHIKHVLYPFVPYNLLLKECLEPLGISVDRTAWAYGRAIGHMGGADVLTGYEYLVQSEQLFPGDYALLIGEGAGFVWTAAVIETLDAPRYGAV